METMQCKCLVTGDNIDCKDCVQTITDMDYSTRDCNKAAIRIDCMLKSKAKKAYSQVKEMKEEFRCDCGNLIRIFNTRDSVKCFSCNSWHDKEQGKWIKSNDITPRDQMTIGDIPIRVRKS
jgi:hypothetical protein